VTLEAVLEKFIWYSTLLWEVTSRELSIAPGRTLATMFLTDSDMSDADDRPSDISSDALIITPLDVTTDNRGTVAYLLPADMSLDDEFDVRIVVIANNAEELSS